MTLSDRDKILLRRVQQVMGFRETFAAETLAAAEGATYSDAYLCGIYWSVLDSALDKIQELERDLIRQRAAREPDEPRRDDGESPSYRESLRGAGRGHLR